MKSIFLFLSLLEKKCNIFFLANRKKANPGDNVVVAIKYGIPNKTSKNHTNNILSNLALLKNKKSKAASCGGENTSKCQIGKLLGKAFIYYSNKRISMLLYYTLFQILVPISQKIRIP